MKGFPRRIKYLMLCYSMLMLGVEENGANGARMTGNIRKLVKTAHF